MRTCFAIGIAFCALPKTSAAIEISIHNELRPEIDGAILQIQEGRSVESPKSKFSGAVHPGKTIQVTRGNVTSFLLTWPFERHKLKYEVLCPPEQQGRATITLLDVHNNKLPGGCQVSRVGHWSKRSGISWTNRSSGPLPPSLPIRRNSRDNLLLPETEAVPTEPVVEEIQSQTTDHRVQ